MGEAENVEELPDEAEVDVGGLLSPADIRGARLLERLSSSVWIYSDGQRTELRRVPKALERVAISRSRQIAREEQEQQK